MVSVQSVAERGIITHSAFLSASSREGEFGAESARIRQIDVGTILASSGRLTGAATPRMSV